MVIQADEEARRRAERARQAGLFRYQLIQDVIDPQLSAAQRGALVRELAGREHDGPAGARMRVSEQTIRRWARAWRAGGFEALVPAPARVTPRTPAEVLALAVALKRENPDRTAVQITRILRAQAGWAPSDRTLQRHFTRLELDASRCNEIWTGDALHGPVITGRKTYLFAFLDDRSRAVMAARFGFSEDTVRLAAALRPALASRGVPEHVYVDNGSAFVDSWLLRACASLGIKLVHSAPGRPQGRGKIERFFRTVRDQFLVEITGSSPPGPRPSTTPAPSPRPGRRRCAAGKKASRSRCPCRPRPSCGRRSCGVSSAPSPRPPPSPCTATPTRSTSC